MAIADRRTRLPLPITGRSARLVVRLDLGPQFQTTNTTLKPSDEMLGQLQRCFRTSNHCRLLSLMVPPLAMVY